MKDEFNMKNAWLIGDIHGELSPIEKFYVKKRNKLICPYDEACAFDIRNNKDYEFDFIVEQIFGSKKNLFDFRIC